MHVRTPCVGMCSTTFGDLVCRGCKRWAHEITGWNAFDDAEKACVVARLDALREGCVDAVLVIDDEGRLRERAQRLGLAALTQRSEIVLALLRRGLAVEDIGCHLRAEAVERIGSEHAAALDSRALYQWLDAEFLVRAEAAYELSHRVPVR